MATQEQAHGLEPSTSVIASPRHGAQAVSSSTTWPGGSSATSAVPCATCSSAVPAIGAESWFENLAASGTAHFQDQNGAETVALPDKFNMAWGQADQELHIVSTDKYMIGFYMRTFDPSCRSLRSIYLTLPDNDKLTTTYPLLLNEPIPWLSLSADQTASTTSDNSHFIVTIHRVGNLPEWTIDARVNPKGPGPEPWLISAQFKLRSATMFPPWSSLSLSFAGSFSKGSFSASGSFSRASS